MIQIYFQYSKWSGQNFNSVKLLHLQCYLSVSRMLCEQFKIAEKKLENYDDMKYFFLVE